VSMCLYTTIQCELCLTKYLIQTVLYVSLIFSKDADQDVERIWNVFELSTSSDALGPGHVIIDPDKDRD
jgi:hypothetical protein